MASKNNNRQMVPEARQALEDMKFEIARELGVDVKGYGGDLLLAIRVVRSSLPWLHALQVVDHNQLQRPPRLLLEAAGKGPVSRQVHRILRRSKNLQRTVQSR